MIAAGAAIARATLGVIVAYSELGAVGLLGILEVVALVGLSWGLLRRSRVCALALCAVLLAETVYGYYVWQNVVGLTVNLIIVTLVAKATAGIFEYARVAEEPHSSIEVFGDG